MNPTHYLRTFEQLLGAYDHSQPLYRFLSEHFRKNKQMGSRDRRMASKLCFAYFRLGKALANLPTIERLAVGLFLTGTEEDPLLQTLDADLATSIGLPLAEKAAMLQKKYDSFTIDSIFPYADLLSKQVDASAYTESMLRLPDLFIRTENGWTSGISKQLQTAGIPHTVTGLAIRLPNQQNLQEVLKKFENQYEIQDLNSQATGAFFEAKKEEHWWDCCAASGGKSLLLHSLQPQVQISVSDLRQSSLLNLKERFKKQRIRTLHSVELDLSKPTTVFPPEHFDGIIVDAPCSGSGTWARSPEQISSFKPESLKKIHDLQYTITKNAVPHLKVGQPLIYITCSVFEQENEAVITRLENELPLKLERMELLKGYDQQADTLFAARLIRT